MKVAVMQPYFFPYIGYWQLLGAVDNFVIFDDVNYITKGWINRNKILNNGKIHYLNVYLKAKSQNKLINEIEVNNADTLAKCSSLIVNAYKKAPFFSNAYPIIAKILNQNENNLAKYNGCLIRTILDYLGLNTEILYSSEIEKDNNLKGQDKIIAICKALKATEYINAIGGRELYDVDVFKANGIRLRFLQTNHITYKQFDDEFYEDLSIVDVIMFNDAREIKMMLSKYYLV